MLAVFDLLNPILIPTGTIACTSHYRMSSFDVWCKKKKCSTSSNSHL